MLHKSQRCVINLSGWATVTSVKEEAVSMPSRLSPGNLVVLISIASVYTASTHFT